MNREEEKKINKYINNLDEGTIKEILINILYLYKVNEEGLLKDDLDFYLKNCEEFNKQYSI